MKEYSARTHPRFARPALFLLLLVLATFRPFELPFFYEVSFILLVAVLVFMRVTANLSSPLKILSFVRHHPIQHILLGLMFLSLIINRERYESLSLWVLQGVLYPVILYTFFLALVVFRPEQTLSQDCLDKRGYTIFVSTFGFIAVLAIWQWHDVANAHLISQYFIANDLWPSTSVTSVFAVSTDLGSILGLSAISFFFLARHEYYQSRYPLATLFTFTLFLILWAGFISGSKIFILILLFSSITYTLSITKVSVPKMKFALLVLISGIFLAALNFLPADTIVSLSQYLPWVAPFHFGESIYLKDAFSAIKLETFAHRGEIWSDALRLIKESPLLGISNGGFRLYREELAYNTHSWPLQVIVDAGFIGFGFALYLVFSLIRHLSKQNRQYLSILTLSILACLFFDFQADHSLPWIVCVAFLCGIQIPNTVSIRHHSKSKSTKITSTKILLVAAALLASTLATYALKYRTTKNLEVEPRVASVLRARFQNHIVITDSKLGFNRTIDSQRGVAKEHAINQLASKQAFCQFDIYPAVFVTYKPQLSPKAVSILIDNEKELFFVERDDLSCNEDPYPEIYLDQLHTYPWLSHNRHYYLYDENNQPNYFWVDTTIQSATFVNQYREINLSIPARNLYENGATPNIEVTLHSANKRETLFVASVKPQSTEQKRYHITMQELPLMEAVYITIRVTPGLNNIDPNEKNYSLLELSKIGYEPNTIK